MSKEILLEILKLLQSEKYGKNKAGIRKMYNKKHPQISEGRMSGLIESLEEIEAIYINPDTKNYHVSDLGLKLIKTKHKTSEILVAGLKKIGD